MVRYGEGASKGVTDHGGGQWPAEPETRPPPPPPPRGGRGRSRGRPRPPAPPPPLPAGRGIAPGRRRRAGTGWHSCAPAAALGPMRAIRAAALQHVLLLHSPLSLCPPSRPHVAAKCPRPRPGKGEPARIGPNSDRAARGPSARPTAGRAHAQRAGPPEAPATGRAETTASPAQPPGRQAGKPLNRQTMPAHLPPFVPQTTHGSQIPPPHARARTRGPGLAGALTGGDLYAGQSPLQPLRLHVPHAHTHARAPANEITASACRAARARSWPGGQKKAGGKAAGRAETTASPVDPDPRPCGGAGRCGGGQRLPDCVQRRLSRAHSAARPAWCGLGGWVTWKGGAGVGDNACVRVGLGGGWAVLLR
jgi:hypothetical protein